MNGGSHDPTTALPANPAALAALPTDGSEDPRVVAALEEYLEACQRGSKPGRDVFLAQHAEIAGELAACLDGLDFVHDAAREIHSGDRFPANARVREAGEPLGDFRILCEIGRGGMGVVYEAEQISLRRRVALKVLPMAATMDPRHLQRFKNEAQAAAVLHHPYIVPVYAVGCERGVHYYAMQFIEGQSLAWLIDQLRQQAQLERARAPQPPTKRPEQTAASADPDQTTDHTPTSQPAENPPRSNPAVNSSADTVGPAAALISTENSVRQPAYFRTVARLGMQAAEALEHAHQQGIIHRDIKPANLLLDGQANVWITDFGLAHVQSDTRMTMTGDILGTFRYMSPEQALGKQAVVDHRTDVYSLGATLYELLTLEPAVGGGDRQQIMRQLAYEEPVAPRRLNRAMPAELETIVLKSLAKEPTDRYATAKDLADDLRRFLEDRPIQAKPPTVLQRSTRFVRRHRVMVATVVLAAFSLLAVTVGLLSASNVAIARRQRATEEARDREAQASYLYAIALAHREWQSGNVARALELLNRSPPEMRRFEWHYLRQLCESELLTLRHDKGGPIFGLAVSGDGQRLSATSSGGVHFWSPVTGESSRDDIRQRWSVGVTFRPDGERLATHHHRIVGMYAAQISRTPPDDLQEVRVWDFRTGERLMTLPGHGWGAQEVQYSPDGNWLVTAGDKGLLKLWDANTGNELRSLAGHQEKVLTACFSPDGKRLASLDLDGMLCVWDCQSAKRLLTLRESNFLGLRAVGPESAGRRHLAFSADGKRLAAGNTAGEVKLWDAASSKELKSFRAHDHIIMALAFSPDGSLLATAADHEIFVKLWNIATGREWRCYRGHSDSIHCLTFTPDGRRLISGGWDGTVKVWDLTTRQDARFVGDQGAGASSVDLTFSPDGKRLACGGLGTATKVWNCDTPTGPAEIPFMVTKDQPLRLTFDDRGRLHWLAATGEVKGWDFQGGGPLPGFKTGSQYMPRLATDRLAAIANYRAAFSADGRLLVCTNIGLGNPQLWDIQSGTLLREFHVGKENWSSCVGISPDGNVVASAHGGKKLLLWDAASGQPLLTAQFPEVDSALSLTFSPDAARLVVAGETGFDFIETIRGTTIFSARIPRQGRMSVAFSPDGQRLALGLGSDFASGGVRIWETSSGQELLTVPLDGPVGSVAFSPDGRRLAAAEQTGRIWLLEGQQRTAAETMASLEARTPRWLEARIRDCQREQNFFAAAWHIERLRQYQPLTGNNVRLLLQAGAWDQIDAAGAEAAAETIHAANADIVAAYSLAWLHVQRGDTAAFRRLCTRMRERLGNSTNPGVVSYYLRLCVLAPGGVDDPSQLAATVRQVLENTKYQMFLHYATGAALFRAGQYEEALRELTEATTHDQQSDEQTLNSLFLAMTCQKLGRTDEARQWLANADEWRKRVKRESAPPAAGLPSELALPGVTLRVAVGFDLLRREAAAMLPAESAPAP